MRLNVDTQDLNPSLAGDNYNTQWMGKAGQSTKSGFNAFGKTPYMTTFISTFALKVLNFLRKFKTTSGTTTRKHTMPQSKNQISDKRYQ
jgi:hypothetical protein